MNISIATRSMILAGALVALTLGGCKEGIDDFIGQGRKAARMQNYEEALKFFNKALDIEPGNYNALWGVADVYQREGNLVKQAQMLEKIMANETMAKDYAGVVVPALEENYRRQATVTVGASADMAIELLRKAIKLNKRSEANGELAKLLMKQGDRALRKSEYATASKNFEEAQKLRIPRKLRNQIKGKASIASFFTFKAEFLPTFEATKAKLVEEKIYNEASKAFVIEAIAPLGALSRKDPEFQKKAQRLGLVAVTNALATLSWRVAGSERPQDAFVSYSKATVDIVEQGMARQRGKAAYRFKVSVPEDAVFEKVQEIKAGKFRTLGDEKADAKAAPADAKAAPADAKAAPADAKAAPADKK